MSVLEEAKAFHVREKILHPDVFEVFRGDDRNVVAYEVHGKILSFYGRKSMFKDGEKLFKLEIDQASLVQTTYMQDVRTDVRYKIQKKGFLPCFGRKKLQVFEGLENFQEKYYVLTSPLVRKEFEIIDSETDMVVATVNRKWTARQLVTNAHSYDVNIIRDVDEAFILMLAVIIDEQYFVGIG